MDIVIPALFPFCVKEFVDFGFLVNLRNPEFVGGGGQMYADLAAESALSFPLTPMWFGILHIRIS